MPTYQYACTEPSCANRFEVVQSFTDAAIAECPVCGNPVRKVYGSVGVVFKGSGFYRNDSRNATSGATSAKSESKPESKSESKSESKPSESKSESKPSAGKSESSSSSSSSSSSGKAAASA